MQSNVPPLPISCLTNERVCRNNNLKQSLTSQKNKNKPLFKSNRNGLVFSNKKNTYSTIVEESPYGNKVNINPPDTAKSSNKSVIYQRVSSAKMLRVKQLQNQLADAHYHLNELSKENKLLKTIQKRQDVALKRYEGRNAELPRIIHTHHEDLRVLQTKFKKLKLQFKETNNTLKEKENELYSLQVQNKKLLQLSKDRQLGEREKLQMQVFDLNHRVNEQDEVIQTLKRKLALESKYLKHQLHMEMIKHKETQKQLQDSQFKLKSLEQSEQKVNRPQINRIAFFNKDRSTATSQSLINLNGNKSEILFKGHNFRRYRSDGTTEQSLPALHKLTILSESKSQENQKLDNESFSNKTETQMNFEQIRHFRLLNSPNSNKSAPFSTTKNSIRNSPIQESQLEDIDYKNYEQKLDINLNNDKEVFELPKTIKHQFFYPIHDVENIDEKLNIDESNEPLELTNEPKLLHIRSTDSTIDNISINKTEIKNRFLSSLNDNTINIENDEETKSDDFEFIMEKDLLKNDIDAMTQYSCDDSENEIKIPIEFNIDKDKNVIPKSNKSLEVEVQTDTSSHMLQFSQFSQTSNHSLDSNKANDKIGSNLNTNSDEIQMKSLDNSLISSTDYKNDEKFIDNSIIQKDFNPSKLSVDNMNNSLETNKNNLVWHETNSNEKIDLMNKEDIFLVNNEENSESIKENSKNFYSHEKTNEEDMLEKSDLKHKAEQKTVQNVKVIDKAKLLAAMKAIDDNENIELINKRIKNSTDLKKKSDIIRELFTDNKLNNNKNVKQN